MESAVLEKRGYDGLFISVRGAVSVMRKGLTCKQVVFGVCAGDKFGSSGDGFCGVIEPYERLGEHSGR